MSNKSIKSLKDLSKEELEKRARDAQSEIFKNRIKNKTGQLENKALIWKARKELARMKMLLGQMAQK
jgi:ribosomal protein L29